MILELILALYINGGISFQNNFYTVRYARKRAARTIEIQYVSFDKNENSGSFLLKPKG